MTFNMTGRDWILLLIPIVVNVFITGIILFAVQRKLILHYEHIGKVRQEFRDLAYKAYKETFKIKDDYTEFNKVWGEVVDFHRLNKEYLDSKHNKTMRNAPCPIANKTEQLTEQLKDYYKVLYTLKAIIKNKGYGYVLKDGGKKIDEELEFLNKLDNMFKNNCLK